MRAAPITLAIVVVLATMTPGAAAFAAETTVWFVPPVDGPVVRGFERPGTEWGPGHRGIDLAVAPGTHVRAAAAGTVTFAGRAGDTVAVTIAHGGGLETTYSTLATTSVAPGDVVRATSWIGTAGAAHAGSVGTGSGGLHFGVKLHGDYVDPAAYLGPLDVPSAIYLAPLVWEPPGALPAAFREPFLSASAPEACDPKAEIAATPAPPNRNLAVLVAGIGSKTKDGTSAALYEAGRELFGHEDIYPFSYRGSSNGALHEPYERSDTFGDIDIAARRLRALLRKLARRHPGRAVDLIAHSQGGILARVYLSSVAQEWHPDLPRVEHLVTFSSPHAGAPLAGAGPVLDETLGGRALLKAGSWWSSKGGPLPDPYAPSVAQLAPGSSLMDRLAQETVVYGTRVLTLSIPHDVVVPASSARWPGHPHGVAPPTGLNGHDAIVGSRLARGIAHGFLRDRPAPCRDGWDLWGPRVGRAIAATEAWLPRAYGVFEALLKW